MYVSSLVLNAPVKLNDVLVTDKATLITDMGVLSIGTCSFRFVYNKNFSAIPLAEANGVSVSTPSSTVHIALFEHSVLVIACVTHVVFVYILIIIG